MPVVEGTYIGADQADSDAGVTSELTRLIVMLGVFATLVAARGLTLEASVLGRGGGGA
jgi:hypothetical protein